MLGDSKIDKKLSNSEAGKLGWIASKEKREARYKKLRELYYKNPKYCFFCKKIFPYEKRKNKFCSHSCSASFSNFGRLRNLKHGKYALKKCLYCKKQTTNPKYCSIKCQHDHAWEKRKKKIKDDGYINVGLSSSYKIIKRFLIETRSYKCEICGIEEWTGVKVPLVLDHIDGNSDNNLLKNLRLICYNCHALTDTFCGKNRGNGQYTKRGYMRNKRYIKGLNF